MVKITQKYKDLEQIDDYIRQYQMGKFNFEKFDIKQAKLELQRYEVINPSLLSDEAGLNKFSLMEKTCLYGICNEPDYDQKNFWLGELKQVHASIDGFLAERNIDPINMIMIE
ncbi:MAG: hypothetical protein WC867_04730 [Candidatus Pacearchaeota archaeon]|jgi:hypothetical protein